MNNSCTLQFLPPSTQNPCNLPKPGWTAHPKLPRAQLVLLNPEPVIKQIYVLLNCASESTASSSRGCGWHGKEMQRADPWQPKPKQLSAVTVLPPPSPLLHLPSSEKGENIHFPLVYQSFQGLCFICPSKIGLWCHLKRLRSSVERFFHLQPPNIPKWEVKSKEVMKDHGRALSA